MKRLAGLRFKFIAVFLISPALCQYAREMEMIPDVTFGEHNDRFDISNLVDEQNQFENYLAANRRHRLKEDRDEAMNYGPQDEEDRRRSEVNQHHPGRLYARRFSESDFAYHDNMDSSEGGTVGDFERALDQFRANNARRRLRNFVKYMRVKPEEFEEISQERRSLKKHAHRRANRMNRLMQLRYDIPKGLKLSGLKAGN